jgi:hypothetical protein
MIGIMNAKEKVNVILLWPIKNIIERKEKNVFKIKLRFTCKLFARVMRMQLIK